ncbi:ATP-binding protein [Sphingomonas donggukensis]|uniref:histidine kinase n=1 Tax=Sphingomonas donggukensis TaxID=2949093 RepID=A0ABY4TY69_9SPHN|nr:ATP-binding protein [Sphingomonas donggukensis]URW76944.1 ATP-binding protein [Sphingomonas donggukensis]
MLALALVAGTGIAAWLLTGDGSTTLLVPVIGAAAVLLGAGLGEPVRAIGGGDADTADNGIDALLDAVDEPILVIAGAQVVRANRAARALVGEHVIAQDVRLAIRHPAAAERLIRDDTDDAAVDLVGLGQRDQHWQMRLRDIGGERRLIHLSDRTDSRAADRIRVDFVANASHELRTPLASILGFIETLQEGAGEEPEVRARFLRVMDDEARRMERLVGDLMSLSRIEAEKFRAPETRVDLAHVARGVCVELSAGDTARAGDLVLDASVPVVVPGDAAQLSQLLHNLVGNAMKYGRVGTPVTIAIARDDTIARVTVTDEGDGIAPEHLPRLTERFYRVDPGRSRAVGGTGLGLAIVKHIVERHRGRLDIRSMVGQGTTIAVVLPAAPVADDTDALSSCRNETATGV